MVIAEAWDLEILYRAGKEIIFFKEKQSLIYTNILLSSMFGGKFSSSSTPGFNFSSATVLLGDLQPFSLCASVPPSVL